MLAYALVNIALLLAAACAADVVTNADAKSGSCKVADDQLIVNGKARPLTEVEKKQLADYTIALDEFFKATFHPRQLGKSSAVLPKFPDLCKGKEVVSEHHVTAFDGCSISDDQLYVEGKFVRKLTDEEKKQLKTFREGIEQFKTVIDGYLKNQLAGQPPKGPQPQPPTPPKICPASSLKHSTSFSTLNAFTKELVQATTAKSSGKSN